MSLSVDRFVAAAMAIKAEFGLSLFGFDLIVPVRRGKEEMKVEEDVEIGEGSSCNKIDRNGEQSVFRFDTKIEEAAEHTVTTEVFKCYSVNYDDNNAEKDLELEEELELVVIDVNYFPSYKEVPDFPHRFRKFLRERAGMLPAIADREE